ncbi:hypothetical protein ADUPG1_011163, partial [Aduncisulcus paluster]
CITSHVPHLSIPKLLLASLQFHKPHQKNIHSALTVCARGIAKHQHREMVEVLQDREKEPGEMKKCKPFWGGEPKGIVPLKNARAFSVVIRILCNTTWMNYHHLPHGIYVCECRVKEGYGCRWMINGGECTFRGFLEPFDPDGHEKGWKHKV